ncbi:unnamed protein product [Pedinophyceae sp. YPF-701]|nr:unnamed protein product [Pedinophyceae sp. YPF-701]
MTAQRRSHVAKADAAAGAAPAAKIEQPFVEAAVWNKNLVRAVVLLAAGAVAAKGAVFLPANANAMLHMCAFGTWFGTMAYTTFAVGILLFKNLPRQTFGKVQSKLFPVYFGSTALCIAACAGSMVAAGTPLGATAMRPLLVAMGCTLVNLLYLEPKTTVCMFKRYELENAGQTDGTEYKALRKQFGPLHGMSSLFNLGAFAGCVAHAWTLAAKLAL